MTFELDFQVVTSEKHTLPTIEDFKRWIGVTLQEANYHDPAELTVRIVDEREMITLNETYCYKRGTTNVLSFPYSNPAGIPVHLLGDVVICAPTVEHEAKTQGKNLLAHWAHIVIHGVLHLLGYDHQYQSQAELMETMEIHLLAILGYPDPYKE